MIGLVGGRLVAELTSPRYATSIGVPVHPNGTCAARATQLNFAVGACHPASGLRTRVAASNYRQRQHLENLWAGLTPATRQAVPISPTPILCPCPVGDPVPIPAPASCPLPTPCPSLPWPPARLPLPVRPPHPTFLALLVSPRPPPKTTPVLELGPPPAFLADCLPAPVGLPASRLSPLALSP